MMQDLHTLPLTPETWPAFSAMAEAHNGVWGGCWCLGFHAERNGIAGQDARRAAKAARVAAGTTHAALVMAGDACLGWAQFGPPAELPMIKNLKAYEAGRGPLPDWRITCFFVDKGHRREGLAAVALDGALRLIGMAGGGRVEAYPEAVEGQKTAAGFLFAGTLGLFEKAGFVAMRKIGLHRWVVQRDVSPVGGA